MIINVEQLCRQGREGPFTCITSSAKLEVIVWEQGRFTLHLRSRRDRSIHPETKNFIEICLQTPLEAACLLRDGNSNSSCVVSILVRPERRVNQSHLQKIVKGDLLTRSKALAVIAILQ